MIQTNIPFGIITGDQDKVQPTIDNYLISQAKKVAPKGIIKRGDFYQKFYILPGESPTQQTEDILTYLFHKKEIIAAIFEIRNDQNFVYYSFFNLTNKETHKQPDIKLKEIQKQLQQEQEQKEKQKIIPSELELKSQIPLDPSPCKPEQILTDKITYLTIQGRVLACHLQLTNNNQETATTFFNNQNCLEKILSSLREN